MFISKTATCIPVIFIIYIGCCLCQLTHNFSVVIFLNNYNNSYNILLLELCQHTWSIMAIVLLPRHLLRVLDSQLQRSWLPSRTDKVSHSNISLQFSLLQSLCYKKTIKIHNLQSSASNVKLYMYNVHLVCYIIQCKCLIVIVTYISH